MLCHLSETIRSLENKVKEATEKNTRFESEILSAKTVQAHLHSISKENSVLKNSLKQHAKQYDELKRQLHFERSNERQNMRVNGNDTMDDNDHHKITRVLV